MKRWSLVLTLSIMALFVVSSARTAAAAGTDMFLLSFGKGKVEMKLYSDYFCSACKNLEPRMEYLVSDLIKKNVITITFVDAPFHAHSSMYSRYFLYILNHKKEIGYALKARAALFEAAQGNITDTDRLEEFLAKKGFKLKPFDAKPVFSLLQRYLQTDQIKATPTLVVMQGDKKEISQGVPKIMQALEGLK